MVFSQLLDSNPDLRAGIQQMDRLSLIASISGLLTVPHFHAHTYRIEILAHLAVALAAGKKRTKPQDLSRLLNENLGSSSAHFEDPVEDVFVGTVTTPSGSYRLFEGLWESSSAWLQHALDLLFASDAPSWLSDHTESVSALLRLSDSVVRRAKHRRYTMGGGQPGEHLKLPKTHVLESLSRRTVFQQKGFS